MLLTSHLRVRALTQMDGLELPASAERLEDFIQHVFQLVEQEIQNRSFDRTFPCVFFLPGECPAL